MKTLKDLGFNDTFPEEVYDYVSKDDLKQAAIEWIKIIKGNKDSKCFQKEELSYSEIVYVCRWIKHFFNISEEDLQ